MVNERQSGHGPCAVERVLNFETPFNQFPASSGANQNGDVETGPVQFGGTDGTVDPGSDDENARRFVTHENLESYDLPELYGIFRVSVLWKATVSTRFVMQGGHLRLVIFFHPSRPARGGELDGSWRGEAAFRSQFAPQQYGIR